MYLIWKKKLKCHWKGLPPPWRRVCGLETDRIKTRRRAKRFMRNPNVGWTLAREGYGNFDETVCRHASRDKTVLLIINIKQTIHVLNWTVTYTFKCNRKAVRTIYAWSVRYLVQIRIHIIVRPSTFTTSATLAQRLLTWAEWNCSFKSNLLA